MNVIETIRHHAHQNKGGLGDHCGMLNAGLIQDKHMFWRGVEIEVEFPTFADIDRFSADTAHICSVTARPGFTLTQSVIATVTLNIPLH